MDEVELLTFHASRESVDRLQVTRCLVDLEHDVFPLLQAQLFEPRPEPVHGHLERPAGVDDPHAI